MKTEIHTKYENLDNNLIFDKLVNRKNKPTLIYKQIKQHLIKFTTVNYKNITKAVRYKKWQRYFFLFISILFRIGFENTNFTTLHLPFCVSCIIKILYKNPV